MSATLNAHEFRAHHTYKGVRVRFANGCVGEIAVTPGRLTKYTLFAVGDPSETPVCVAFGVNNFAGAVKAMERGWTSSIQFDCSIISLRWGGPETFP